MKIWIVTTVDPEAGGQCITPNVFATEAEAVAFLDGVMRQEWEAYGLEDDEDEPRPYPGDWQKASDALAAHFTDGSYGEWMLTPHEVSEPSVPARKFTVVMLNQEGDDACIEHVECDGPGDAYLAALRLRFEECEPHPEKYPFDESDMREANPLLAVFAGHLIDLQFGAEA